MAMTIQKMRSALRTSSAEAHTTIEMVLQMTRSLASEWHLGLTRKVKHDLAGRLRNHNTVFLLTIALK